MDCHAYSHETVRKHLDRREEVSHIMASFNRDLMDSKQNLERLIGSPMRQGSPLRTGSPLRQQSPYRQGVQTAMAMQQPHQPSAIGS